MKNLRFPRTFHKPFGLALSRYLVICVGLIGSSHALGQGAGDTPTGPAGGYGGSITTGGGSFDPYERNATRSITDIVVPGAVVPFTYTRIWNSQGGPLGSGWRHNWQWDLDEHSTTELGGGAVGNDLFYGYTVHYPDGRVVQFNKPTQPPHLPIGAPGTYLPNKGVQDRFVIQPDGAEGHLLLSDGTVVNFDMHDLYWGATSIVDPHGLKVTITNDGPGKVVTEPGGRKIFLELVPGMVTTSLGQSVTYTSQVSSGYVYEPYNHHDPDSDDIQTTRATVRYNDVIDPATGQPVEAHYVYKAVQVNSFIPNTQPPDPHNRLIWASDPMFNGPLQQVKFVYVDNPTDPAGDAYLSAVLEVRWAPNYWDPNLPGYWDPNSPGRHNPGVLVSRVEMPPWTYSQSTGQYSEGYWTRQETRGDGPVRTMSYLNSTTGNGQPFVDHLTDFKNDLSKVERYEYQLGNSTQNQFQTPTKITDARHNVTEQTLDPVLGHITKETHMDTSYRSWTYTDPAFPYYVGEKTDDLTNLTTYTRDSITHRVRRIDHPGGSFETFDYNDFGQITQHQLPSGAVEYSHYDLRGLLQWEYNSVDGWDARKEYTYYQPGEPGGTPDLVKTMTDGRARAAGAPFSTRMTYNGRLQVTKVEYPDTGAPAPMPSPPSLRPAAPRLEVPTSTPAPTPCQYCCDPMEDCAQIGPLD